MSAARTLATLAAVGKTLEAPPGAGLRVRGPGPLPPELRAEVRAAAPALLRVSSGRWREDLAAWPAWRREAWEERVALMAEGMPAGAVDLAERCAFLDVAELPDPQGDELSPVPADHQVEQLQDAGPAVDPPLARSPENLKAGFSGFEKPAQNGAVAAPPPPASSWTLPPRPPGASPLSNLDTIERDGLLVLGPIRGRAPLASPSAAVDPGRAAAWLEALARRLDAGLDPESAARLTSTTHGPRPA